MRIQPVTRKRRPLHIPNNTKSQNLLIVWANCLIKKVLELGIVASNKKVLEINETYRHWQQPLGGKDEAHDATASGGGGHASILETQRYLKYMPEQIELAATVSTKLAQLANAKPKPTQQPHNVACPQCGIHSVPRKQATLCS